MKLITKLDKHHCTLKWESNKKYLLYSCFTTLLSNIIKNADCNPSLFRSLIPSLYPKQWTKSQNNEINTLVLKGNKIKLVHRLKSGRKSA
jgi:hypothetical protein